MAKIFDLDIRPGEDYAPSFGFLLEGVQIRIDFRWLSKLGYWMAEFRDPQDNLLGIPQKVVPGGEILLDRRDPRVPPGRWGWSGPDPYDRRDLGGRLKLYYVTSE